MVLLPWFCKCYILTNCQNCVQPPYYPFFKVMRKRKTKSKIQICFSMSCENEKWKWHLNSIFPCHRKTVGTKVHAFVGFKWLCKNDKRNSDLFFKVIRKRETKFKSVFQSNAKTKKEKRNSYPFFKVMRKRKTKTEIDIRFLKWYENEKRNTKCKTVFQS